MNLLGTLGLEAASANPNEVPNGTYDAVIVQSDIVLNKNKDSVAHVITFQVQGGEFNGAKPAQWNTLGNAPRDAQGNFPNSAAEIVTYTPTMTDQQKAYYKNT